MRPISGEHWIVFLGLFLLGLGPGAAQALAVTNGTWINPNGAGFWSGTNNWSGGSVANGTGSIADFSTLDIAVDSTVSLDSTRTVGSLVFGDANPTNNWTLDNNGNAGNTLTLATSSGTPMITVNNRTATISAALVGSQGLTVAGSGVLALTAANALTGSFAITGGSTLQINSDAALGPAPANPTADVSLSGNSTLQFAANMTLNSNRSIVLSSSGSISTLDTQGFNVVYGGKISGGAELSKAGSGTLLLNGPILNTGGVLVAGGTLQLGPSGTFASGPPSLTVYGSGGTFDLNGISQTVDALKGTFGSTILNNATGTNVTFTVGSGDSSSYYSGLIADNSAGTGTLALRKVGAGTTDLDDSPNTYSGGTTIAAGTLAIQQDLTLGAVPAVPTTNVTFSGTSTLRFYGNLIMSANRLVAVNSGAVATFDEEAAGGVGYGGVISGGGALIKQGLGPLTLSGANTYTGGTTIYDGLFILNGSLAAGSALTIGNSAQFTFQPPSTTGGSQSFGTLSLSGGDSKLQVTAAMNGNTSLSFTSLASRAAGASALFVASGGANGTTNKIAITAAVLNSFVDPGVFFGTGAAAICFSMASRRACLVA